MRRLLILAALLFTLTATTIFPSAAQSEPLVTKTVYTTAQRFEHGLMIWRSDTAHIWALLDDGPVWNFPQSSYQNLPDNKYFGDPPDYKRMRPIFGFGQVWGNHADLRKLLGWPTLPEIGWSATIGDYLKTTRVTQLDGTQLQIMPNNRWERLDVETPQPEIVNFEVTPYGGYRPGDTLTFSWQVQGTDLAQIAIYRSDNDELVGGFNELPISGETTFTIPSEADTGLRVVFRGVERWSYLVWHYEPLVEQTVFVGVDVADGLDRSIAFQQYERGFMIWWESGGSVEVYAGATKGNFWQYAQVNYENLPDNPITDIPPGFVKPINAFGKVWGNYENVRDLLGHAVAPEQGFTTKVVYGMPINTISFALPDDRKVMTFKSEWSFGE